MKSREQAIKACMTLENVYEDYPFDDFNWTVMRHCGNKKSFAYIFEREGEIWINLKVKPELGEIWREIYENVVPAYHMNKFHWISVILNGKTDDDNIMRLILDSYNLTKPKQK